MADGAKTETQSVIEAQLKAIPRVSATTGKRICCVCKETKAELSRCVVRWSSPRLLSLLRFRWLLLHRCCWCCLLNSGHSQPAFRVRRRFGPSSRLLAQGGLSALSSCAVLLALQMYIRLDCWLHFFSGLDARRAGWIDVVGWFITGHKHRLVPKVWCQENARDQVRHPTRPGRTQENAERKHNGNPSTEQQGTRVRSRCQAQQHKHSESWTVG
jgi:hypothetical protein